MPQPITKPLIASSNFLEFRYEIVTSTYYHASLCFMTTVYGPAKVAGVNPSGTNPPEGLHFFQKSLV